MATMTIQFANGRTKTLSAREQRNKVRWTALLIRRSAAAGYPCAVMREDLHRTCV